MNIFLSTSSMPIIQYVAILLGWLMNGIFILLDTIGLPNIGMAVVIFTIVIYLVLTPVQYTTQKSSKMMAAVGPEIQKVQKKYQGRRDQYSMQQMQQETQQIYDKYGVSMTGSCLPMFIQLLLLFAVYQVILYIPGYITRVRMLFDGLATKMMSVDGCAGIITNFISDNSMRVRLGDTLTQEKMIDFLYALKPGQWTNLQGISQFSSLQGDMASVAAQSYKMNYFLGINISESPWDVIKAGFSGIGSGTATVAIVVAMIVGILIPVLAWFTQWLNYKLMPQQNTNKNDNSMAGQMQTMNMVMPIFSAFICLTLSMGIGIYWIIGAVMRCIQQVIFNRKIGKMDLAEMEMKERERKAKKGIPTKSSPAGSSYRSSGSSAAKQPARSSGKGRAEDTHGKRAKQIEDTEKYYSDASKIDSGSITAKANMVRSYDAKKGKKK